MATEMLLLKGIDYMLRFLKIRGELGAQEKELRNLALEALREAVSATRAYLADMREGHGERDREKELELSRKWNTVGIRIRNINTAEAREVYEVSFVKADYWSDPEGWKRSEHRDMDISLEKVQHELSELLR